MKTFSSAIFDLLLITLVLCGFSLSTNASVVLNSTNFPDAAFRAYIANRTGVDIGGTISDSQLAEVTSMNASNKAISDLKGIEYFTKITELNCSNNQLSSLDVSKNTELVSLMCSNNKLTSLDITHNTMLYNLECQKNQLTSLDVSKNRTLTNFNCIDNQLSSLDISNNKVLNHLDCSGNKLTNLNVVNNLYLNRIQCSVNQLTSLDVSKNISLQHLDCAYNKLTSLDVSKNTNLMRLICYNNQLTSVDVSMNTKLERLDCIYNKLTSIDVSNCTLLNYLDIQGNQIENLDVTSNTELAHLCCSRTALKTLNLSNLNYLKILICQNSKLTSLTMPSHRTQVELIACSNNSLRSLDLSNMINLKRLECSNNNLSYITLTDCVLLEKLVCNDNELRSLNLSKNTRLTELSCGNNYLTYLDLENNSLLTSANINKQTSTRRFQVMRNNDNTSNCWALYVGTTNAARIYDLKIDGIKKNVTLLNNDPGWMVVSDDLKNIPKKVVYSFRTYNTTANFLNVIVNYDVKNYGVYIDGTELTSLNFYDIPGLKSGTAYFTDEYEGIGWSGYQPTLVLNNAKIEGEEGLVNKDCYYFKIIARGDNEIKATDYNAFDNWGAAVRTVFSGGGTIRFTATGSDTASGSNWHGMYAGDYTITELTEGTTVICKGIGHGYFDDCGRLYIKENSALMAYGTKYPSVELPKESDRHFDSNIAIRYPVGAYYDDKYSVCYAGTTTKVQKDWVVIGPPGATPPQQEEIRGDVNLDQSVDIADAVCVLNAMAGQTVAGDANVNGDYDDNGNPVIDIADLVTVLNIMAGQ